MQLVLGSVESELSAELLCSLAEMKRKTSVSNALPSKGTPRSFSQFSRQPGSTREDAEKHTNRKDWIFFVILGNGHCHSLGHFTKTSKKSSTTFQISWTTSFVAGSGMNGIGRSGTPRRLKRCTSQICCGLCITLHELWWFFSLPFMPQIVCHGRRQEANPV